MPPVPRSFADDLRGRDDAFLGELLRRRPDLAFPLPANLSQLAERALTQASTRRAVDRLDQFAISTLQELATTVSAAPDVAMVEKLRQHWTGLVGGDLDRVIDNLVELGLLWGDPPRPTATVREVFAATTKESPDEPRTTSPPPAVTSAVDPDRVDRTGAGAAAQSVRWIEELGDHWSTDPPDVMRSGGLALRDIAGLASQLHVDAATATFAAELAYVAGLVDRSGSADERWLPTPRFDRWLDQPAAARWVDLAAAWLPSTRAIGLVGSHNDRGQRRPALGPDLDRVVVAELRTATLQVLQVPQHLHQHRGSNDALAVAPDSVVEQIAWRFPRRGGQLRADLVRWSLQEANLLGLTALDALTSWGSAVLEADPQQASKLLHPRLPPPVDHIVIQADLSAIAPGPLLADVHRKLRMTADLESSGSATVWRFGESSVRRALDAGWSANDVHTFLAQVSQRDVPQPLTYLVDDTARRHGQVRVSSAQSIVRCDDPIVLDTIASHRLADAMRLRRLAPTVLVSELDPRLLLERLRSMNVAAVAESAAGDFLVQRVDVRRAPERPPPEPLTAEPPLNEALQAALVRSLRSGERGVQAQHRTTGPAGTPHAPRTVVDITLALLREAASTQSSAVIGYVGDDGTTRDRVVDPVDIGRGRITAFDHRSQQMMVFALHRISGVALLRADR